MGCFGGNDLFFLFTVIGMRTLKAREFKKWLAKLVERWKWTQLDVHAN